MDLDLLRPLIERDSRTALEVDLDGPAPAGFRPKLTGRELHDLLREAQHQQLFVGDAREYGADRVIWFTPRLTLAGLRALGAWPPPGGEMLPGRWDADVWGTCGKPALKRLADNPPRGEYLFGPTPGSADPGPWIEWDCTIRLLESGLIEGSRQTSGIQDVRVTGAGRTALRTDPADPMQVARVAIARDAKGDAVNAAIEEALRARLVALAPAASVDVLHNDGPKHLSVLNDQLAKAGAYSLSWRAEIGAWLALRNDVDHGRGTGVAPERLERLIAGVERFLAEHPAP